MKYSYLFLFCFFCIITASVTGAEYYNYTDESGVKHFTENISDVPEKFRPQVQIHRTIRTPASQEEQKTVGQQENPEAQNNGTIKFDDLLTQKEELKKLYSTLLERAEQLEARKETMDLDEYNTLVEKLNDEIRIYHEKNKNYELQVEKYNHQIMFPATEKEESSP
jgi:hypothetical protein